jgi:1,4-alpha-glucan branching enzyme
MWTHPGKKLLFMGGELAQPQEWNHDSALHWELLADAGHAGISQVIADLNRLYQTRPDLHATDTRPEGFGWLVSDDADNSVFAYARGDRLAVVVNMTPVPRHGYRIGIPAAGAWREILNTDSAHYGGSDVGNGGAVASEDVPSHGMAQSLTLTLPPLAALILEREH